MPLREALGMRRHIERESCVGGARARAHASIREIRQIQEVYGGVQLFSLFYYANRCLIPAPTRRRRRVFSPLYSSRRERALYTRTHT